MTALTIKDKIFIAFDGKNEIAKIIITKNDNNDNIAYVRSNNEKENSLVLLRKISIGLYINTIIAAIIDNIE